jgi:hypothetical protein
MYSEDQEERIHSVAKSALVGAVGFLEDEINDDRAKALKYFKQREMGTELPGRSKVVTSEVSDTVLSIIPSLMRVFTSAGKFVRYEARSAEGEGDAKMATSYVNDVVFSRDNDMFTIAYNWFFDALVQKNGIVTWYWYEREYSEIESYEGLTDIQLAQMVMEFEDNVVAHTEREDGLHDVDVKIVKMKRKLCIENVPPDEFLIAPRARSIEDAPFVGWRTRRPVSELVEDGFDYELLKDLAEASSSESHEEQERFEEQLDIETNSVDDAGQREVWVCQAYVEVDVEEDGTSRLLKVTLGGEDGATLLDIEEAYEKPFASICPIPIPHVFHGMSMADLTMPLQDISTAVFRGVLDSIYLANNPRMMALEGKVNLDDLLNPRAGGVVRAKQLDAVRELNTTFVGGQALPLFDLINDMKENRTGVSRRTNGLSAEALQNTTATAAAQMQQGAAQRLDMIARLFANGVKDLCRGVLRSLVRHQGDARNVKIGGQWQDVDPSGWDEEMDVRVSVGLGFGNDQERITALMMILAQQKEIIGAGSSLSSEQHVYNTLEDLVELSKLNSVDTYFQNPATLPPKPLQQPQVDPLVQIEQMRAEAKRQGDMLDAQTDQQKMALDRQKFDIEMAQKRQQFEEQMSMQWSKFMQELDFKKQEAAAQLATKTDIAEIQAEGRQL